jgi:hypothetical protein
VAGVVLQTHASDWVQLTNDSVRDRTYHVSSFPIYANLEIVLCREDVMESMRRLSSPGAAPGYLRARTEF